MQGESTRVQARRAKAWARMRGGDVVMGILYRARGGQWWVGGAKVEAAHMPTGGGGVRDFGGMERR